MESLILAVTAKYASMAIRKMHEVNWRPNWCVHYGANSVGLVIRPAGAERAVGLTSAAYMKDPTDEAWSDDAGMKEWRAFMAKYMPEGDLADINHVYGYSASRAMHQVLRQSGEDLSRENIMRQAANLRDVEIPTLLPGIRVNSSPTNFPPIRQMQLMRWNGQAYERFGQLMEGNVA